MKLASVLLSACVSVLPLPALANAVTLNFGGIANGALVGNYYNGGAGGNLGVSFTDAVAVDSASISGEPTPPTVMTFPSAANGALMNVAGGFTTGFSLYYSSSSFTTVSLYDGLNGTGNLLGSFDLAAQSSTGCFNAPFCNWSAVGTAFSGTAYSVDFSGTVGRSAFDNVTIGSSIPGIGVPEPHGVPEPPSIALIGLAMAGLLAGRSRHPRRVAAA